MTIGSQAVFDADDNDISAPNGYGRKVDARAVLKANLEALIAHFDPDLPALNEALGRLLYRIRQIRKHGRAKPPHDPKLSQLNQIAAVFPDTPVWHLLYPDLNPAFPPSAGAAEIARLRQELEESRAREQYVRGQLSEVLAAIEAHGKAGNRESGAGRSDDSRGHDQRRAEVVPPTKGK